MIREYIHEDYYPSGETPAVRWKHVDHCLDVLRQIIICHGDISIVTFDWVEGQCDPYPNFHVNRECRNWDSIFQWAKDHHVDRQLIQRPLGIPRTEMCR